MLYGTKLQTLVVLSLLSGGLGSIANAFDAGTSDPEASVSDELPGSIGCRLQATYLTRSRNITELLLIDYGNNVSHQYGGMYYASPNNSWSADETIYSRIDADYRVGGNVLTYSDTDLENLCGWTSATITDLTPTTMYGDNSFANANTASMKIDFEYLDRRYSATGSITGEAGDLATVSSTLLGTNAAPTSLSTTSTTDEITVTFTAPIDDLPSDPDEAANTITDYQYEINSSGNWISGGVVASPIIISNLTQSTQYSIRVRAVNGFGAGVSSIATSTSTTLNLDAPAVEFARHKAELTEIIQTDALRILRGSSASQQQFSRGARDRIMETSRQNSICDEDQSDTSVERRIDCYDSADNVAFTVDGTAQFARGVLSARGTFYELLGNIEADKQRLFYGDFSLQRDADGDTTASFNAKMAWEQQLNDASLWGYFVGGSFGNSDIGGTFEGSNDKLSIEAGLYGAHNLVQNLYIDGYAAMGLGANDLELDNGVLVLGSNFTTRSFTTGMALSGVYAEDAFELRPELSVNYGKTWISDVGFTGQAYGLTDGTLSLDAGSVELGTIMLRPEFIIPLDQQSPSQSNTTLSVSPRFVCEGTRQNSVSIDHCGSGAEIGLGYSSDDGLGQADIKLMMDNIAGGTRSSWNVSIEQKF